MTTGSGTFPGGRFPHDPAVPAETLVMTAVSHSESQSTGSEGVGLVEPREVVLPAALDAAGVAIAIIDASSTVFLSLNHSMAAMLDSTVEALLGESVTAFKVGETGSLRRRLADRQGRPTMVHDVEIRTPGGRQVFVDLCLSRYERIGGIETLLLVLSDTSVRVEAQTRAQLLVNAVDAVTDLVAVHDLDTGHFLYVNRAFHAATGLQVGDHLDLGRRFDEPTRERLRAEIRPAILREGSWTGTAPFRSASGDTRWMRGTVVGEFRNRQLRFVTMVLGDVTTEHHQAEQLAFRANHDDLTGLPNRGAVLDHLHQLHSTARVALCHLDIDRFQEINDLLGHEAGDDVICEVARRLREHTRPGDLIGRVDGDEFVVVLHEIDGVDDARRITERLNGHIFDAPFELGEHTIKSTASFGLAMAGAELSGDALLRAADGALYRAKSLGRSHIEVSTAELQNQAAERSRLIEELRQAIDDEKLFVHYQPVVAIDSGRVVSLEALVRWTRDDGTMTPPDDFIGLAESVGLIDRIDRFVLERALADLASLDGDGHELDLHVNLSAACLSKPEIPSRVARALAAYGIPASRLCIEVTETALAKDPVMAADLIDQLAALGVQIAIDDFGTGYSSLAALHRFDLDVLKIDRSFVGRLGSVDGADGGRRNDAIVSTILHLAEALGLEVVAEGIETENQARFFAGTNCRLAQGYHFHRPQPIEQIRDLLGLGVSIVQPIRRSRAG